MVFQRIRDMREDADLKQNDMAKILHCSQQAYSNYELGQRDIPTDILIALAEYHKTNVDYLLGLTKNKTYYKDMVKRKEHLFPFFLQPISYTFIQSSSMYDLLKLPMTFLEKKCYNVYKKQNKVVFTI